VNIGTKTREKPAFLLSLKERHASQGISHILPCLSLWIWIASRITPAFQLSFSKHPKARQSNGSPLQRKCIQAFESIEKELFK
jgi:hypothetical protein